MLQYDQKNRKGDNLRSDFQGGGAVAENRKALQSQRKMRWILWTSTAAVMVAVPVGLHLYRQPRLVVYANSNLPEAPALDRQARWAAGVAILVVIGPQRGMPCPRPASRKS